MNEIRAVLDPEGATERWVQERWGDAAVLAMRHHFGAACQDCVGAGSSGPCYHDPEPPTSFLSAMRIRLRDPAYRAALDKAAADRAAQEVRSTVARREEQWKLRDVPFGLWPHLEAIVRKPDSARSAAMEADAWVLGKARVLVIAGASGVGKSVAAAWALHRAQHGLFAEVKAAGPRMREEQAYWERLQKTPMLVLDDVGEEAETECPGRWWHRGRVRDLLDTRWNWGFRTVITTRMANGPFVARYGDSVASRIGPNWIEIGGEDMR